MRPPMCKRGSQEKKRLISAAARMLCGTTLLLLSSGFLQAQPCQTTPMGGTIRGIIKSGNMPIPGTTITVVNLTNDRWNSLSAGFHCHRSQATLANPFPSVGGSTDVRSYDIAVSYARTFGRWTNVTRGTFASTGLNTFQRADGLPVVGMGSDFADCRIARPEDTNRSSAQEAISGDGMQVSGDADAANAAPTQQKTGFSTLLRDLGADFKHLPSIDSLTVAAIGGGLAIAVHPFDDDVNQPLANDGGFFNAGNIMGNAATLMGASVAAYGLGRATGHSRVAHVGLDLLRAQIVAGTMVETLKFTVRREQRVCLPFWTRGIVVRKCDGDRTSLRIAVGIAGLFNGNLCRNVPPARQCPLP
jgi:hypothetical protein